MRYGEEKKVKRGSNPQHPLFVNEQLFSCLALFRHSQRPGEVALWLDHLEVVSILSWPGFESSSLRVFPSKQQHLMA